MNNPGKYPWEPGDKINIPYCWEPRDYQRNLFRFITSGGRWASWCAHRRAGKDLTAINIVSIMSFARPGVYWHVLPTYEQAKKIVWHGKDNNQRPFLDYFHPSQILSKHEKDLLIKFKNGAIYQLIGGDKIDSQVGTNPSGIIASEFAIMSPNFWKFTQPIIAQNQGWFLAIFTPRGKNHAWRFHETAKIESKKNPKEWFCETLSVDDTGAYPIPDKEGYAKQFGISLEQIEQEYFCSFNSPLEGAYFSNYMKDAEDQGRVGKVKWESEFPVNTAWDLGIQDLTVVLFYQVIGNEVRVIDRLAGSGNGLEYYVKKVKEKPYMYDEHYFPHDIKVREMSTGKTRIQALRNMGLNPSIVKKTTLEDGIEAVRVMLPKLCIDVDNCDMTIQALKSYHRKYDNKLEAWGKPVHDWSSHDVDAIRMLAQSLRRPDAPKNGELPQFQVETPVGYGNMVNDDFVGWGHHFRSLS